MAERFLLAKSAKLRNNEFPTAVIAAVRLPRDSIANVCASPLASMLSFPLFFPPSFFFFFFSTCHLFSLTHRDHSNINTNMSLDSVVQRHFPSARTGTSPSIHTSLHSIAIICSYGYIKKYVHQVGNLWYKIFSPFTKVRMWQAFVFLTVLSPKYGSLHREVTLSVNSVHHPRLSSGCHVRRNSQPPSPVHRSFSVHAIVGCYSDPAIIQTTGRNLEDQGDEYSSHFYSRTWCALILSLHEKCTGR